MPIVLSSTIIPLLYHRFMVSQVISFPHSVELLIYIADQIPNAVHSNRKVDHRIEAKDPQG